MPTEDGYDRTWLQDISYDGLKKLARVHGIEDDAHALHDIDGMAAWFVKAREVPLRRERYVHTVNTSASMRKTLVPDPPRTRGQLKALEQAWRAKETHAETAWREGLKLKLA